MRGARSAPALALACLAAGLAATRERALAAEVAVLSCDSLRVTGTAAGWAWLEADLGDGFLPLGELSVAGTFTQILPLPAWGRSLAWRPARLDSLGLPDYGDEELWSRPFPVLEARLAGARLSGRALAAGGCPPPDLLLRVEREGRVVDLLRLPPGPAIDLDLGDREFDALRLAFAGQDRAVLLSRAVPQGPAGLSSSVLEQVPAAPELLGLEDGALRLASPLPLVLEQGAGRLEPAGDGVWRLEPAGGALAVEAVDAAGRHSLPFLWEEGEEHLAPRLERLGPGLLQVAGGSAAGLELAWLDGAGRQGRLPLGKAPGRLEALSGFCLLQVQREGRAVWSQRVDLAWPAPAGLAASSASDTLLRFSLEDPRGWSPVWELEWRGEDGAVGRRAPAAAHALVPGAGDRLWLRWRAGLPPAQSRWSPWREVSLVPGPPVEVEGRPAPGGLRVTWRTGSWLEDRVEWLAVAGDDSSRGVAAAGGELVLDLPADRLVELRLRRICRRRAGAWSAPLWTALPRAAGGASPELARSALTVAEFAAFARAAGLEMPPGLEVVEDAGTGTRPGDRLTGVSPREAIAYANWVNESLGLDGRTGSDGVWRAGRGGGYRLPRAEAELDPGTARCWLLDSGPDGARAAGLSPLRPQASPRRTYSLAARQPDVGVALVRAPGE